MTISAEEAVAWLESLAPYSTAERDRVHREIAALVRSLERIRVAAELVVPSQWDVAPYQTVNTIDLTLLAEALAAHDVIAKGKP